jgi:hypothetical protein
MIAENPTISSGGSTGGLMVTDTVTRPPALFFRVVQLCASTSSRASCPSALHLHAQREQCPEGVFQASRNLALRSELPEYLKPVLTFGYYMGARAAEVLALKWHQVDLKARIVTLEAGTTKNDQPRTLKSILALSIVSPLG